MMGGIVPGPGCDRAAFALIGTRRLWHGIGRTGHGYGAERYLKTKFDRTLSHLIELSVHGYCSCDN
jgi:hypothetical protein